ncbi:MAG: TonB-dependent receptor [Acidobacteriia bacterium]|nr:TonB-dependent receptor [Terriglobia bacterium]
MVRISLLALLVSLAVPLAFSQDSSELLGTVRDPAQAAVAKASVTLINQSTGAEAKTATDESGNYNFFDVRSGTYTVTVEIPGFSKFTAPDIAVNVGARQRVDVKLLVGAVTESITVTGAATLLETDTSEHGQLINTKQIVELPLNGRSSADLALLATNVHKSPFAVAFAANATPREGSFNANGMRSTYNNFLLDGIDNNAYSTSNQGFSNQVAQLSPDALTEFKVITSNFSAEYGRVGGAVVNSVMRSGTNEFHGSVFEFLRNTDLNAIGYIFGQRPATFKKPTLQRNQFGASIGGPFIKNKIFFFGDYEGFRQLSRFLNFDSLPTLTDRAGTLPVTVVNPRTGAVYPANTPIPSTSILPFASKVLNELPSLTGSGRSNNFQQLLLLRDYADRFDAKMDGHISDKMTAFVRFNQRKDNTYFQPDIPGPSGGGGNGYIRALQQAAAVGLTWTTTPTSLFDVRLGFSHILGGKNPPYLGGASMQDAYGIPGLPTSSNLTGGLNSQSISGFNAFGRQSTNPQFQNPTTWNPKFNYSWIKGRHSVKTGYEFSAIRTEVNDINPLYGLNTYSGNFSKPTCAILGQPSGCTIAADSASYNLADFLFGLPSQLQLSNLVVGNYRQHVHSMYVQDDYRMTPKLTLNLGLRWEFATPRWERDNIQSNFDPKTISMVKASDSDRTLVDPDYSNFGPRLGLAYSIDQKTVFRAGYGISYSHFNRVGSADELGINGPQVIFGLITQSIPQGGPVPSTFITAEQGYPAGVTSPANFNPLTSNNAYIPRDTRWPYVQSWVVSIQRELMKNTVIEIGYNGNHALRLPIIADYNQAAPNAVTATCNPPAIVTGCLGVQARRPISTFSSITWVDPAGQESYNGLSIRVEHRLGAGLYFLNSFTWSKALGNSEQALESYPGSSVANPQDIRNLAAERGPSSFDVGLMNVTSVVYQLPFGKGKRFGANFNRGLDLIAGGWEINGINSANSGPPLNVIYSPAAANDVTGRIADYRGVSQMRPNLVGDTAGSTGPAMLDNYFNKAAFQTPTATSPFGTLGRNALRSPGLAQLDLSINKNFRFTERVTAQFRSEFFNILNHTNFGLPNTTATDAAFGTIRTIYPPRQIQFGLKILF